jgi:hypothetical protein
MEEKNKINDYEMVKQIARTLTVVTERIKQVVDNSKTTPVLMPTLNKYKTSLFLEISK